MIDYYKNSFKKHGLTAKGCGWHNEQRAIDRYGYLFDGIDGKILDYGCGTSVGLVKYIELNRDLINLFLRTPSPTIVRANRSSFFLISR